MGPSLHVLVRQVHEKTTGQFPELPANYRPNSEKLPANFQKLPAKNAGAPPIYLALD